MNKLKQSRTRQLLLEIGIALIIAVVARFAWNQWSLSSRPLAQVGTQTLSQRQYRALAEVDLVHQMLYIQNRVDHYEEELAAQNGKQQNDAASLEQNHQEVLQFRDGVARSLKELADGRIDSLLIDQWIDQEIVLQGAAREQISVSQAEIAAGVGSIFSAPVEEEHHHGEDEHADEHAEAGHSEDEHGEEAHASEAITETEQSEAAPAADPAAAETLLADSYTKLKDVLNNEYGIAIGVSQATFADYVKRSKQVELLSERVAETLTPDDQVPVGLQVNGQYLLVTPSITDTGTSNPQAAAKAKAEALYQQVKNGADFLKLALEHSANPEEVVEPGWSSPDSLWPSLKEAVLSQPIGEVSPPVETPSGWYLVKILEREERRDIEKLKATRSQRYQQWKERQRAELGVKQP
jgi:hypothetical protein